MRTSALTVWQRGVAFVVAVACVGLSAGPSSGQALPLEPPKDAGMGITPAFEGWYQNEDGTYTLLVGFFNRNAKEAMDIPIGPNNRIEPGGPDLGQPTFFGVRRNWGVFTIKVPKDFGNKRYTWTIVANGQSASVPIGLVKGYQVEPYRDAAMKNEPPRLKLEETGKEFVGPPMGIAATYTATVGQPLTLTAWLTDVRGTNEEEIPERTPTPPPTGRGGTDATAQAGRGRAGAPPLRMSWHKFRGPGDVTFAEESPKVDGGKATTTATFSAPGEYIIRAQANDRTGDGGGGFQCCWTNAHVKVTVKAGPTTK
jgi:hypothetical protein